MANIHELQRLVAECAELDGGELLEQHGISIEADGSILDEVNNRVFKNARAWATYILDADDGGSHGGRTRMSVHRGYYADE